jgi:hypothetical protein
MKLGEPTRQLEFMHESRLATRRTSQKYLEQTRVETRPTLFVVAYSLGCGTLTRTRWRRFYGAENAWDWELLVRQLAQVNIFGDGELMARVMQELGNRRRIWRCAEESRMDNIGDMVKEKVGGGREGR